MKKKKAFKEREQLKNHTDSSDTGSKDNKTSDWTKSKHLSKTDQDDLKTVKKLYEKGKYHEARQYACNLPANVSKAIPGLIWKEIGGEFTLIEKEQLSKEENKTVELMDRVLQIEVLLNWLNTLFAKSSCFDDIESIDELHLLRKQIYYKDFDYDITSQALEKISDRLKKYD